MFALSILVAMGLATLALHTNFLARSEKWKLPREWAKPGAALVMGSAVAGMHYTGMAAAYFFPSSGSPSASGLQPMLLAVLVAVATALILGLAILVAMVDRRVKAATHSARISQGRLMEAIESISEGFCLYDRDDRLVVSNSHYRELLDHGQDRVEPGERFESILRRTVSRGLIPEAESDVDAWVSQRLARHQNPREPFVEKRRDGRCIRISERKTQEGGTVAVYSDITELSLRNQELEDTLARAEADTKPAGAEGEDGFLGTAGRRHLPRNQQPHRSHQQRSRHSGEVRRETLRHVRAGPSTRPGLAQTKKPRSSSA